MMTDSQLLSSEHRRQNFASDSDPQCLSRVFQKTRHVNIAVSATTDLRAGIATGRPWTHWDILERTGSSMLPRRFESGSCADGRPQLLTICRSFRHAIAESDHLCWLPKFRILKTLHQVGREEATRRLYHTACDTDNPHLLSARPSFT